MVLNIIKSLNIALIFIKGIFLFFVSHGEYSYSQIIPDTLSSSLPLVIINTDGKIIRDEPKITARMGIIKNDSQARNSYNDDFNDYDGFIGIEIRGNSSQEYPKKSYGFETRLEDGSNNNVRLLDLPRENDWVLYGPYADKSLMRNVLIFKLAIDIGRYSPRTRFCELIINDNYLGVYVLMEKIKRDDDRVDIAKLDRDDIYGDSLTGGYILKCDWGEGNTGWESTYSVESEYGGSATIIWEDPKPDELTFEQKEYIQIHITEFEEVLKSKAFRDPILGYYSYVDLGSFIDFMICQELANNVDAYALSTFFYKQRDSNGGKLVAGPLWDFNFSFGNADYGGSQYTTRYSFNTYLDPAPRWWLRMLEDSVFTSQMGNRWRSLRDEKLNNERLFFIIDSLYNLLDEAQKRNFERWKVLGEYIWPNYFIGDSFSDEIGYLKDWIEKRLNFLDEDIPKLGEKYNLKFQPDDTGGQDEYIENNLSFYPNPSHSKTTLLVSQKVNGPININIYNIIGQKVAEIVNTNSNGGINEFRWDLNDQNGSELASGIYFAVMKLNYGVVDISKFIKIN